MTLRRFWDLVLYNVKIVFRTNFLVSLIMVIGTPFIFNVESLNYIEMAKIGEYYICLVGIFMFTYVASLEERHYCEDIICSKKTPFSFVFLLRLFLLLIATFAQILMILYYCKTLGGTFPFWEVSIGLLISAVYIGVIGITVGNFAKDATPGYLLAFSYFLLEFITKGKYTGSLYLHSLVNESFRQKYNLSVLVLILVIINIIYISQRKLLKLLRK